MISMKASIFKFIDRGRRASIVLIPGWATDYRIFNSLDLKFNYLIPINFSPFVFEKGLLTTLKDNNLNKISLFGWSLGGFLACDFALKHTDFIDKLILVSIRKRYRKEKIEEIKDSLKEKKKGYLYKFYAQCFYNREQFFYFRKNLLKRYCRELDLEFLINSLNYLSSAKLEPELLKKIKKITILHGEYDKIAPLQEAREVKNSLTQAKFILIKEAGHIPFLEKDFSRYVI